MPDRSSEILNLAQELIEVPSTSDNLQACQMVLEIAKNALTGTNIEEFSSINSNGQSVPSLLFYNTDERPDRFKLLLNAHLDVVAADDSKLFIPMVRGDKLYGRGAQDMKAAAAALICVFNDVAHGLDSTIGLSLTVDEEVGGYNGALHQVENGVKAEVVIAGEPTDLEIGNQHKGLIGITLSAKTAGGHTAYDGDSSNALLQIINVQLQAARKYPGPDGTWRTSCTPTITQTSNRANNVVPSDATGRLSIRYIPQDNADEIIDNISSIDPRIAISRSRGSPSHYTNPGHPGIQKLAESIQLVTGSPSGLRALPHSSDVVHWAIKSDAAVDFGPEGAGMHTTKEYVSLNSLEKYSTIIRNYLLSLS